MRVRDKLNKYNCHEFLEHLSYISSSIMSSDKRLNDGIEGCYIYKYKPRYGGEKYAYITPNNISKIAYNMIKTTNDHKNHHCHIDEAIRTCINISNDFMDEETNVWTSSVDKDTLDYFLITTSQTQFWWQRLSSMIQKLKRNEVIMKNMDSSNFVTNAIYDRMGINLDEYLKYMKVIFTLCFSGKQVVNLMDIGINEIDIDNKITSKIIKHFTINYNDCRESKMNYNILIFKPFVETDKGKVILTNYSALLKTLSESTYMITKEFYKNCGQEFPNKFGIYFESYLEMIFKSKLEFAEGITLVKLKEVKNTKMADWILETDNYMIILEQKSSMLKADLKLETINMDDLDDYCCNRIGKGIEQLNSTQSNIENIKGKKIIKILVHYEELYLQSRLRNRIENKYNSNLEDILFANIEDIEDLILFLEYNQNIFDEIIKDFVWRNKSGNDINGCDLSMSIDKFRNKYNFRKRFYNNNLVQDILNDYQSL